MLLKFSLLRNSLEVFINAVLEYLYIDLLSPLWDQFFQIYSELSDFDLLRKSLASLVSSIQEGLFWDHHEVGLCFRKLAKDIRDLKQLLDVCNESVPDEVMLQLDQLQKQIYKDFGKLVTVFFIIVDTGKVKYASKLLLKLNFNDYFKQFINDNYE